MVRYERRSMTRRFEYCSFVTDECRRISFKEPLHAWNMARKKRELHACAM